MRGGIYFIPVLPESRRSQGRLTAGLCIGGQLFLSRPTGDSQFVLESCALW